LSVIFAHSDNLCGIFILSRKSKTQSINELKNGKQKKLVLKDFIMPFKSKYQLFYS